MNKLDASERTQILNLLCEGMAIRAVARVTGKSKNTITKLLIDAGKVLGAYQDRVFVGLQTTKVQVAGHVSVTLFANYSEIPNS